MKPYLLNFSKMEEFMTEIRDAFEELFEAFDDLAPFAFALECAILIIGSICIEFAWRALG